MESVDKKTKKKHIIDLFKIDENSILYENEVDRLRKNYNKSAKMLNLKPYTSELDEVSLWLKERNKTLLEIVAKGRGIEELNYDLVEIFNLQKNYYDEKIAKVIYENAMKTCHSISDVHVVITEGEYKNCINSVNFIESIDNNLLEIENFTNNIIRFFYQIITQGRYSMRTNIDDFIVIIDEAIMDYEVKKRNYSNIKGAVQLNPYLNLYMYVLCFWLKRKYSLEKLEDYIKINDICVEYKEEYDINDVVVYLLKLGDKNKDYKKVRQKVYKCLRNIREMDKYKKNNKYSFPQLSIPVAYYLYFSRKNVQYNSINVEKVNQRVEPILMCCMHGNYEDINKIYFLLKYIDKEINEIFTSVNHIYQSSMMEFISEIFVNSYYRLIGLSKDIVYWKLKE